jgi:hypothetical protein
LSRGGQPVDDVVQTYATGRADRFEALRRTAKSLRDNHQYPVPGAAESPLTDLGLLRSVALGQFLDVELADSQREAFR